MNRYCWGVTHPATYRPKSGSIPESAGVYRFKDADDVVIYVGKASNLRSRLNSYFADVTSLHPRTYAMVNAASKVDWVTVNNEVEALQVEYSWIKEYDPRFNVRYRDDKSYPYLAVTMNEEFPRVQVMRGAKKPGVKYFGPYAHAWAIRETVDQLLRVFPMRSCSQGVFQRHQRMDRPCLLGDIGRCAAPCIARVDADEHRRIAEELCRFLGGRTDTFVRDIERAMSEASANQDYELAARLRDDLAALRRALARSAVVLPDDTDADVVAMFADELEVSLQVFHVRGGRVTGQRSFIVERTIDSGEDELVEQFITQLYGDKDADSERSGVPRNVIVSHLPPNIEVLTQWLSAIRGAKARISVPARGAKRELLATVQQNAQEALTIHKLRRAGDLTVRGQAMQELQEYLELPAAPLRIECIDISGHQGTNLTASIVVFEDAVAKKSEYRKYAIADHQDDLAAMKEAVTRRFARLAPSAEDGHEVARRRYQPGLLVVDGGEPQVNAAAAALAALGIDFIAVCGLAKRLEEVWLPRNPDPVILPRRSEGLYLLQRVRDEAHRFAVAYHRQRRAKAARVSVLDEIPGLGPARRKALIKQFGSVKKLRMATSEEIAMVPGIGRKIAATVVETLGQTTRNGGVNVTTGELLGDAETHDRKTD